MFLTKPITLMPEEFRRLSEDLRRPDPEYLRRRDAVFARTEEITITRNGPDMKVDIPSLDLSFLDNV